MNGERDWAAAKAKSAFVIRCGRSSTKTKLECSLPSGHAGSHDFTIKPLPRGQLYPRKGAHGR